MRKPFIILIAVSLLAVSMTQLGCSATHGIEVSDQQIDQFKKGQTTRAEVIAALGDPQDVRFEDGKRILVYAYGKVSMYGSDESSDTTFVFNSDDVLEDIYRSKGSLPDRRR